MRWLNFLLILFIGVFTTVLFADVTVTPGQKNVTIMPVHKPMTVEQQSQMDQFKQDIARQDQETQAYANKFNEQAKDIRNRAKGDRAKIAQFCHMPAAWRPKEKSIGSADEWHIVPLGVISKTYPAKLDIEKKLEKMEKIRPPQINGDCDYIVVSFKENDFVSVDIEKCKGALQNVANNLCGNVINEVIESKKGK